MQTAVLDTPDVSNAVFFKDKRLKKAIRFHELHAFSTRNMRLKLCKNSEVFKKHKQAEFQIITCSKLLQANFRSN